MLYNVVIISLMVIALGGSIWASIKLEQARKAGKIRYVGKVRIERSKRSNDD